MTCTRQNRSEKDAEIAGPDDRDPRHYAQCKAGIRSISLRENY
jgi:hypothetical protein